LNKTDSTSFNTDRSIFQSILERARFALSSDLFLTILCGHERRDFELYGVNIEGSFDRGGIYRSLRSLPDSLWIAAWAEGGVHFYDRLGENGFARSLLNITSCSCLLVAPFIMDRGGLGYGCWLWDQPRVGREEDSMKAGLLADHISLSIKAFQNKKSARERGDKLAALLELSTSIYSSLNYTEVLQKAIKLSTDIMGADGGSIFILEKDEMLLRPLVTIDERYKDQLNSVRLKLGEGITGKVAQSGAGIISNHSGNDPRSIQVPGTPMEEESLISAPLTWSGEVIGVITLWSYSGKIFSREDLEILTIFARQTADAIENAKLFESLEKAYEELSATQEQLIMAEKLKALGDMAGGVAHDFNNVLGTILGRTQLLRKKVTDALLEEDLKIIEETTLKGRRTVQRLQDFTHVSSRMEYGKVDLNKVILEAIETTKPAWKDTAQRAGVTIVMHNELAPFGLIDGSHEELKEAVCNVILNSVDALPEGGNIWIKTWIERGQIILEIRDDGIGMDETVKNKLFFPFFTTKGKKGVGMGLAVVYGILFRHQADIGVESTPGNGATFTFRFNLSDIVSHESKPQPVPDERKSLSILLVDDDTNLLEVVSDMINFLGHEVRKAEGGREALKILENESFDLVITDLGMPEVGGWDIARFCRERYPEMPILLISGWGAQLNAAEALQKVDAILPKPFQIEELEEFVRRVISNPRKAD
jgi:signal transduction histidine kinase/CheY-like chemotaxis protein